MTTQTTERPLKFSSAVNPRHPLPDYLRGLAIVLMILFHGWYDLSVFNFVSMDFNDWRWRSFRAVIVGLFCLMAGASLYWSHHQGVRWHSLAKRQAQLAGGAAILSVFSYFAYPEAWIFFGILHFFVVALLVSLPLVNWPRMALFLGILLIAAERVGMPYTDPWIHQWLQPLLGLPNVSIDRMYLLPWLGVVWIGIWLATQPVMRLPWRSEQLNWLQWMGQHPLSLYLIHQPILYGLAWLLYIAIG